MDLYRRLVESAPDAILVIEDGLIVFANPSALTLTGRTRSEDLLGRPLLDLFSPDHFNIIRTALEYQGPDTPRWPVDIQLIRPTGEVVDVAFTAASLAADESGPMQLVLRDITERKGSERALRESEERFSMALAGALEGVWDWNLETNAVVYSPRWTEMLGYSHDEIEPNLSAWERLVHPDDRAKADYAHESVAGGKRSTYEAEFRLRHKDGHYVHVLSRGFPVRREPGGPVVRIVGTHLDLSERRQAEATLRENEERLKLAFAGAQEGVWDWNLETGDVVYSSRWKEMLGYADDEVEPHVRAWERLLHPDDMERATELYESVRRGAQTYEGEFRLRHKDGHYVEVLSRGYPVRRTSDGSVVRIVGTHFDLTARKRAEAERARSEFLGRLLFAQEDERRRIAREMHDQFGEQLTALALGIRLLKDACEPDDRRRALVDAIEEVAQRLDHDVDQLVWQLRPTALDDLGLRAALANYVQDWSARAGIPAALHSSGLLDERLPADTETALYRIAQEALTNIAKHAKASNVEVILDRRGSNVSLVIEDDGRGFETGTDAPGHAFGLVGMRERAALVGATLEIESSPGSGTTIFVRMTIPAVADQHSNHA